MCSHWIGTGQIDRFDRRVSVQERQAFNNDLMEGFARLIEGGRLGDRADRSKEVVLAQGAKLVEDVQEEEARGLALQHVLLGGLAGEPLVLETPRGDVTNARHPTDGLVLGPERDTALVRDTEACATRATLAVGLGVEMAARDVIVGPGPSPVRVTEARSE